jgi:thiamine biosynthesis lipoprotein
VLVEARRVAEATGGAFDVTAGPFVRLWRRSVRQGELPSEARLAEARAASGWDKLVLHEQGRSVELLAADMRLDLGGIAKGYALDEALAVLRANGIDAALVDGGGDVIAGDPPPGEVGWRVLVSPRGPGGEAEMLLILANEAVATSGDVEQFVEIDGRRFSHIVSTATGLGLEHRVSASVIAPTGMRADALATAVCVLGGRRASDALDWTGDLGLLVVEDSDGLLYRVASPGFEARQGD